MSKTKYQHYVWRNYLKEWADRKGNVFCYLQKEKRIFPTNPINIAVERYFYKTEKLSEADLKWLMLAVERASLPQLREYHRETIKIFQLMHTVRAWLETQKNISDADREDKYKQLDIFEKTLGERWHTGIENSAQEILDQLKKHDPSFFRIGAERAKFVHYITQQFFRTNKLRELQLKQNNPFADQGLDLDRTWFIESQIFSMNVSTAIFMEIDAYKFKFIINDTSTPFITSDQPVISLGPDENGLRLFYPLKPSLALIFEKNLDAPLKLEKNASLLEVEFYNNKMLSYSTNQIYGNDRSYLEALSKMPKDVLSG